MTTLVVNPLETILEQEFTYDLNTRAHVGAFYPYILLFNSPAGVFTLSLIKGATVIYSKAFTSADIKAALNTADNYAHVFYPAIPDNATQMERGTYKLRLSGTGYSATNDSYLGWCQQFEDVQNEMSYTPSSDEENSLAFRLKTFQGEFSVRVLNFADGFKSSTPPVLTGSATLEPYDIANGASGQTLFTINAAQYKSAFVNYELERSYLDGSSVTHAYIQRGQLILAYKDSSWSVSFGPLKDDDDDLLRRLDETLTSPEQVKLYFTTATGVGSLKCDAGTMGAGYEGKIKLNIVRIA